MYVKIIKSHIFLWHIEIRKICLKLFHRRATMFQPYTSLNIRKLEYHSAITTISLYLKGKSLNVNVNVSVTSRTHVAKCSYVALSRVKECQHARKRSQPQISVVSEVIPFETLSTRFPVAPSGTHRL